jgi:cbb3-type cytochrome oxidase subunit 3
VDAEAVAVVIVAIVFVAVVFVVLRSRSREG